MVNHFIQLVGKGFTNQVVGDYIGHRGVQRDQRLVEMLDIEVVDLFHQAVGQIRFIQQTFQTDVSVHHGWRLNEKLFGNFQHRRDLRLDARFARDFIGRLQQVRHLIDVGADKTGHYQIFRVVFFRHTDGGVKVRQFGFQLASEQARIGLMFLGTQDLLADGGGVHGNSRETLDREYR